MTDQLRDRIAAVTRCCRWHKPNTPCDDFGCNNPPTDWDYELADAVIEALDDMGIIHLSKVRPSYADNFCRGGCDCSCCYGMADEPCHCRDAICNCGGDRASHGQKPLEDNQ